MTEDEHLGVEKEILQTWGQDMRNAMASFAPSMVDDARFIDWFTRYCRASASPGAVVALRRMDALIDVRDLLPTLTIPTLVLHRVADRENPIEQGRYLAAHIPGAVLVELPGEDHLPWLGEQDVLIDAVQAFLAQRPAPSRPD